LGEGDFRELRVWSSSVKSFVEVVHEEKELMRCGWSWLAAMSLGDAGGVRAELAVGALVEGDFGELRV
jgi:hypothetical protein